MANLLRRRCRMLFAVVLIFGLGMVAGAMAAHLKEDLHTIVDDDPLSVLIMGDSQMAGDGWNGGYANCIKETYPKAQVLNLAQSGSLLANGDVHAQWEYYLTGEFPAADFILLDGGINDLSYLRREEFKETGLEMVTESFCSLVEQIHAEMPDTRIIYILMPPLAEWKDTEVGPPSYDIQECYWKQMNIIASAYDYVTVLDLFSINPFHFPCQECYHDYFADSIHLNEAGYRKTFEHIDNILVARLARKLEE